VADPNLTAAAEQAGLTPKQKAQIDGLSKLMDSHKKLSALPEREGQQAFNTLSADQQKSHASFFGGGTGNVLGDAFGYITSAAKTVIAAPFKALNEVSDFTTRLYRTGAIAIDQGVDLSQAWDTANDKGDLVFNPKRIQAAQEVYGKDIMSVAVKIASGISAQEIQASGTEEEKLIVSQSVQNKLLLQDAIDAVQAAKYSPGRQLANLLLPGSMEGSGFLYKGISGVGDAAFRIFADPTLQLGKAKKAIDAGNWALFNVLGKEKYTYGRSVLGTVNNEVELNRVFSNPQVSNLFNTYGAEGRKTVLEKFNDGKPIGSYDNYQKLNEKLNFSESISKKAFQTEQGTTQKPMPSKPSNLKKQMQDQSKHQTKTGVQKQTKHLKSLDALEGEF